MDEESISYLGKVERRLKRAETRLDDLEARVFNDAVSAQPGLKGRVVPSGEPTTTVSFKEGKRRPAVGDVWRTRANGLAAVLKPATVLDGGYNVVLLERGDMGVGVGYQYVVNIDGGLLRNGVDNVSDLVAFVRRWAD